MARSMTLRNIPIDVFQILLKEQSKVKRARSIGRYGIEQTIYKIVREFERCKESESDQSTTSKK